ncbi:hypothetical protein D3C86_967570 [compost metagenome]
MHGAYQRVHPVIDPPDPFGRFILYVGVLGNRNLDIEASDLLVGDTRSGNDPVLGIGTLDENRGDGRVLVQDFRREAREQRRDFQLWVASVLGFGVTRFDHGHGLVSLLPRHLAQISS